MSNVIFLHENELGQFWELGFGQIKNKKRGEIFSIYIESDSKDEHHYKKALMSSQKKGLQDVICCLFYIQN